MSLEVSEVNVAARRPRPFLSRISLIATVVVAALVLAGCSGGGGQPSPTAAPKAGAAPETATAPQTSAAPQTAAASQTTKVPVEGGGSYSDVSVAGLATMLRAKDFPLINVHIPYEGEIEPTDAFIPYNEIEQNLSKLPADKGAKIVLYCRSGSMSAIAARALVKHGYTDVYNLDGGMVAWKAAGHPLAEKKQ